MFVKQHPEAGKNDKELIDRIENKFKHSSTIEHIYYNFEITGISRALLQELARHRIASLSVKSTRYTLNELLNEEPFIDYSKGIMFEPDKPTAVVYNERVFDYCVKTTDEFTNMNSALALENLRKSLVNSKGKNRDVKKFSLPESYKTQLAWSINARALQNFLSLRTDKAALWEIRELAYMIYESLPEEHKYLFEEHVK